MKKQTYLFELIKSMNKAEKHCFRLLAADSRGKAKAYLELFEAIEKQRTYDEAALKKRLAKKPWIKNFSSIKYYLYNLLLKSLRMTMSDRDLHAKIHNHRLNFSILKNKGLFAPAEEELARALTIARDKLESSSALLPVLEDRLNSNVMRKHKNLSKVEIDALLEDTLEVSRKHHLFLQHLVIVQKLHHLENTGNARSEETQALLQELAQHPVLKQEGELDIRTKVVRQETLCSLHSAQGNLRAALEDTKVLRDMVMHRALQDNISGLLLPFTGNLAYYAQFVGSREEYEHYRAEYSTLISQKLKPALSRKAMIFRQLQVDVLGPLSWLMNMHLITELRQFLPKAVMQYEESLPELPSLSGLLSLHEFARAYWLSGELDKSHDYLQRMDTHEKAKSQTKHLAPSLMLEAMLFYDEGEEGFLAYRLKNMTESLRRKELLYSFEKTFFSMMKALVAAPKGPKREQILRSYHSKFVSLLDQPSERHAFLDTDVLYFIECKLAYFKDGKQKPKSCLNEPVNV